MAMDLTKTFEPMKEARFHGADRTADRPGDALQALLGVKPQVENDPLLFRQFVKASKELTGLLPLLGLETWTWFWIRELEEVGFHFFLRVAKQPAKRSREALPQAVSVSMDENATKPGEQLTLTIVSPERLPGLDQRFLNEILRRAASTAQRLGLAE